MEVDYNTVAMVSRGVERILIVLISGVLLYLGYKLFHHSASTKTKLDAKYQTLSLYLESTAPGIYFCLFGTALLAFSVLTGVAIKDTGSGVPGNGVTTSYGTSIDKKAPREQLSNAVRSISTLEHLALRNDQIKSETILRIADQIEPLREYFISNAFSLDAYQNFLLIREECRRGSQLCSSLMPRLMKEAEYAEIESLFDPNLGTADE